MSIASEIQTLQANKAAIKAAIEAKNPSVAPTEVMSNWPASIASISGAPALPYDSEVEYLESTGTQYIDSGVSPGDSHGIWVRLSYGSSTIGSNWVPVGCRNSSARWWINTGTTANGMTFGWGNAFTTTIVPAADVKHDVYLNYFNSRKRSWPNGNYSANITTTLADIGRSAYIFMGSNIGTAAWPASSGRIHACQITEGDSVVRNFIPVRVGSIGCLYDRANPTVGMNADGTSRNDGLYFNRGTGAFTVGPDKPTEAQLDAIKSAILAKNPSILPTDDFDTWPDAIASIP